MSIHSDGRVDPPVLATTTAADSGVCSSLILDAGAVDRVRQCLVDDALVARTATLFAAAGDPTRFRILEALSHEELCVCDLAALSGISQSGVSHQLRLLRDRGLVSFTRDGNRAVYRLADEHVRALLAIGLAHAAEAEETR